MEPRLGGQMSEFQRLPPGAAAACLRPGSRPKMKYIERSVLPYWHGASPVDKEGYLNKKGELNTSYQRRWFVLKGNLLFYFERRGERDPLGFILLEGCSVELCESDEEFTFALVYKDPGLRMYKMAAESQAGLEAWIKVLLAASYNYLKMLVVDLRRQYQDLCPNGKGATLPALLTLNDPVCVGACKAGRSNSIGNTKTSQAKTPKRSPKMWAKRVHPAPVTTTTTARLEAPHFLPENTTADERTTDQQRDFVHLHGLYGKEILLLRKAWKEKREQPIGPAVLDGGDEDLIYL